MYTVNTSKLLSPAKAFAVMSLTFGSGVMLMALAPDKSNEATGESHVLIDQADSSPPGIPQAFEQLAYEADRMLHEMKIMLEWAKASDSDELRKNAYALMFKLDEEFTTPLSNIAVHAWEYGKMKERYAGRTPDQFWSDYNALLIKKRALNEQMTSYLEELAKYHKIDIPPRQTQINIFKPDR